MSSALHCTVLLQTPWRWAGRVSTEQSGRFCLYLVLGTTAREPGVTGTPPSPEPQLGAVFVHASHVTDHRALARRGTGCSGVACAASAHTSPAPPPLSCRLRVRAQAGQPPPAVRGSDRRGLQARTADGPPQPEHPCALGAPYWQRPVVVLGTSFEKALPKAGSQAASRSVRTARNTRLLLGSKCQPTCYSRRDDLTL